MGEQYVVDTFIGTPTPSLPLSSHSQQASLHQGPTSHDHRLAMKQLCDTYNFIKLVPLAVSGQQLYVTHLIVHGNWHGNYMSCELDQ